MHPINVVVSCLIAVAVARTPSALHYFGEKDLHSSGCPSGSVTCYETCISPSYSCCPGGGGCPRGEYCALGDNGLFGCCPNGETCIGPGGFSYSVSVFPSSSAGDFSFYPSSSVPFFYPSSSVLFFSSSSFSFFSTPVSASSFSASSFSFSASSSAAASPLSSAPATFSAAGSKNPFTRPGGTKSGNGVPQMTIPPQKTTQPNFPSPAGGGSQPSPATTSAPANDACVNPKHAGGVEIIGAALAAGMMLV